MSVPPVSTKNANVPSTPPPTPIFGVTPIVHKVETKIKTKTKTNHKIKLNGNKEKSKKK